MGFDFDQAARGGDHLGLRVVQAFADEVEIRSRTGEGTEVRLAWSTPVRGAPPTRAAAVAPPDDASLAVPLDPAFRGAAVRVLTAFGAEAKLPVDRLSGLAALIDALLAGAARLELGGLALAVGARAGRLELTAGPLPSGGAEALRAAAGPAVARLADAAAVGDGARRRSSWWSRGARRRPGDGSTGGVPAIPGRCGELCPV